MAIRIAIASFFSGALNTLLRSRGGAGLVAAAALAAGIATTPIAVAGTTGAWTPSASGGNSDLAGVTVTLSGISSVNQVPSSNNLNATNFWSNPYGASAAGAPSIFVNPSPYGTTQTVTLTFSKAVDNPVLHVDRLAGTAGTSVSTSVFTLSSFAATGGSVTLSKIAGNTQFSLSGNSFQKLTTGTAVGGECVSGDATSTGCGSVLFTGTGITSLTFTVTWAGTSNTTTGDGVEFAVSAPNTSVIVKKQTIGPAGNFSFTGTNGVGSFSLDTTSTNPATSATFTVTSHSQPITITETVVTGYSTTASCVDQNNAPVTSTLTGGALSIAASAYKGGGQTITCTFVNSAANMGVSLAGMPATASIGVPYTGSFTCTNAAAPAIAATSATCAIAGLPAGLTTTCTPTPPTTVAPGASISCSVTGTPTAVGTVTLTGTTGATNDPVTSNNTATSSLAVTGSDMTVNTSGLPTTATIGVPYSGTILCTNNSSATASATSATCTTTGLPAGVTVGTCTPTPPATIAAGASISCTVSGTPMATGTTIATTTTGAINDTNGGTTTGGNNSGTASITVTGSDMSPDLTGLPAAATIGVPYSGTIKCTNSSTATASALSASCSITGLPAGVTVGTCTPTPPATVAAGASITCSVSGTPTAGGATTVSVATGATNDTNGGTTTGGNNTATKAVTTSGSDMTISLSGLPTSGGVGQPYSGTYSCTNSSSAPLSATSATCSVAGLPAGLTSTCTPTPPTTVAIGASIACTVTGTPTAAGTSAVNGTTGASNDVNVGNNTASTSIAIGTPSLTVAKTSTTTNFSAVGISIPYNYTVTNSGSVTIFSPITVSDNKIASVSCPALPGTGLAPGASITCTGSYVTTLADINAGGVTNTATATSGTTTSPVTSLTVPSVQSPALVVVKSSTTTNFSAVGVVIPYSFKVTNSGNTTLTSAITVSDNKIASVSCPALPGGGLVPGAFITCTGSYTTTQADVDAGGVTNTASATSGSTTSPTTSLTVPSVRSPAMTIAKTSTTTSFLAAGVSIPYSFKVTNSGNVTLTSAITVSDNKIASVSCPALPGGGLVPGAFITCTGTYITTQADVDAGGVTNTASATSGTTSSPTTSLTINATQSPALTVAKTSTTSSFSAVGTVVPYSFKVTNSGNVTITSAITVSDNKIASVSCPALPGGGLAPGAFITCTGNYTTTQADIDAGGVTNTASATSGTTTSPTTNLTVPATQTRALSIAKNTVTTSFSAVGVSVPYTFVVTNSGNVTITTAVSVTDSKIASVSCPALPGGGLVPGASITCSGSYTTTQADLDAGGVTNSATATSGVTTSPIGTHVLPAAQSRSLSITKAASPTTYNAAGAAIGYTYVVRNTGNITIPVSATISVSDNKIASVSCPAVPAGGLAPNATLTCTATYTTTQADVDVGSVTNTASATDGTVTSPSTSATVTAIQTNALSIVKSSTTTSYSAVGAVIPYSYRVTNTGNTTLTSAVTVSDNKIASVSCPALPAGGLVPGAFVTCTGSYTTTQADLDAGSVTNVASAKSGATTSPSTNLTINAAQSPALSLVKATTTTSFSAVGVSIPFTYAVTNSGNVTLTSAVTVSDNKIASVSCPALPAGGLAPGASITCAGTYVTTQADLDAGSVTNIATAASGATTSAPRSVTVTATQSPALTTFKTSTVSSFSTVGTLIPYSYRVTNSGNVTLTSAVTVSDNKIASVSCPALPAGGLVPGAFIVCSGSYTVTQADIDAGSVTNAASSKSGAVTSPTVTLTVTSSQTPALTTVKSTTATIYSAVGASIPYSYRVTNSGNVTLTAAITVSDDKVASVSCPALPAGGLLPGAFITCTGTHTVTQADIDAGSLTNHASATSGTTTSPIVSVTLPAGQSPALSITKGTPSTSYAAVGTLITYNYVVTNSGNSTLTSAVTVSDSKIPSVTCPSIGAGFAPGASITCSGSYVVTQADIDGGNILNTATATSGSVVSPTVTYSLAGTQAPQLTIAKSSTTTAITVAGQVVPYSYSATNSGNVTLTTAVVISDNKIASVTCPSIGAGLAPGASITCTGSYTATQADIDAGSVVNTASATTGSASVPVVVSNTVALTIPVTKSPKLSLVKSSAAAPFTAAGQTISYNYLVTNTGNVTFTTPVTVSDNKIASVACPALPAGGLVPGASLTCTASYTTTQADVDAGGVTNTATVQSGPTVSTPASVTVPSTQTRSLSLTKAASPTTFSSVGATISYTYAVRNTGNTTIVSPAVISVSDNKIASVACPALPPGGLAPNATLTCSATYTTTQADVDAGSVTNVATATDGTVTSPSATATATATQTPALTVVKSTTATSYSAVGTAVPYSFRVTNSGNVTLTSAVTVADSKIASVSCPVLPAGGLVPGAFITCTGTYTTTQADLDAGSVVNSASAKSGTTTSPSVTHSLPGTQTRSLSIAKTASPTTYAAPGVSVAYTYVVRNTGNITIPAAATISVSDNKIASVSCPAIPAGGLAPNATLTCTATYTTTQADIDAGSVTNIAAATDGVVTSAPATATISAVQNTALSLLKSTTATTFSTVGQVVPYSFRITNSGNTTVTTAVTVSDSKIATVSCPALPAGGLVPGAFVTCTGSYTVTQADIDNGSVVNVAAGHSGPVTSTPPATHTLVGTQTPSLSLAKSSTATTYSTLGASIPYSYRVTNTGNTTLTSSITVSDNKIATVTCPALPAGGLVPAAFITCTGTHTVTQADLDSGTLTNIASATSGALTTAPATLTLTATQSPALTLLKTSATTSFATAGTVISYNFRVTNSGNVTLTSAVTVSDNKIASVTCPALPAGGLVPGAFINCTGTYSTTQADVDGGGVTNTATARSGTTTSPAVNLTINSTLAPALTIAKTSTTASFSAVGVSIPYSYKVTNSGNTTLATAITVNDNKIAAVTCPALPAGGLLPNAFITCTGNYVTTQADVDAGGITNIATASSGATTTPAVNLTIPATQTPALAIAKTSTTTSFAAAGVAIPYSYKVTNAGNVTITAPITVSDNKIASVTCPALPAGGLLPAAFITCTGTYTTTQADVDAGSLTNIASAKSGTVSSPTATLTINAVQTRALTILKTTTSTGFNATGAAIPFSYKVTNSGNVTLTTAITVSDDKIASVSCPALPAGGLLPGAFITCTGTYSTVQADIDAGQVTNTASATSGTTTSPSVSVTVTATQTPGLTIVKTSTTTTFNTVGAVIPYSYKVTNSGNTTLTAAVTVSDNKIASVSCPALPAGGLVPTAFITCTGSYTATQADIDAGAITNTASAKSGTVTSPSVSLTITGAQTPALTIAKSSTTTSYNAVGVVVPYSYKVTNTGNVTLTAPITVSDNKIASVTCPALPAGGLVPTALITCSGSYTVTQADIDAGAITNTASAKSGPTTSPTVSLTITGAQSPALTVAKTSTTTSFNAVGVVIPYSYKVTNSGNVTLTAAVTVSDNKIASVTCPALPAGGLAPAAFITCTGSYTTTQADLDAGGVTNAAAATSGTTVSPTVTLTVVGTKQPALTIVKSSSTSSFNAVGVVIPYSYKVTNSGNVTLTSAITVSDDKIPSVSCPALPAGGLAPGAFITCTGSYTTVQADLNAGGVTNVASAKSGTVVSPSVTLTVTGTQTPSLSIVKTSSKTTYAAAGEVVPYSYQVTNTGNVTLTTAITVTDDKIATVTCPALPAGGLAPGAVLTCTGNYTVLQSDLNFGKLTNVAFAKSGTVTSPSVTLTLTGTINPNFTITKSTNSAQAANNGDGTFTTIFKVAVKNTGNVDLTTIMLNDDYAATLPSGASVTGAQFLSLASSTRGALTTGNTSYTATAANPALVQGAGETLAVGEIITATFSITFEPGANPSGSQFSNTAIGIATLNGTSGPIYQDSKDSVAAVPFTPSKALVVSKTTSKPEILIGGLVPYSITVKNDETLARSGISIVDLIPAGFKYREGSSSVDGIAREPSIDGRKLTWAGVSVGAKKTLTIKLILVAGAGLVSGEYVNEAWAIDASTGLPVSNVGNAKVRIIPDATFDCTDIIGKVFDDANRNGYLDDGERGIANVRLVTVNGQIVTTDSEGRYHIACADIPDAFRGSNFVLKLDVRSLPTGYRVTTENPMSMRITAGKMAKMNFGATIHRVVRIDVMDAAFEAGTDALKPEWLQSIEGLVPSLAVEHSVLRIAYRRGESEDKALAVRRVQNLEARVREAWTRQGVNSRLAIESEIYLEQARSPAQAPPPAKSKQTKQSQQSMKKP